jgi:hypothetical protein
MRIVSRGMAITIAALSLAGSALAAPVETVLNRFCSQANCSDGAVPFAGLIADNYGALYGTTTSGGSDCVNPFGIELCRKLGDGVKKAA